MSRYDGWDKEDLVRKIYDLNNQIEKLEREKGELQMEISSLKFRIEQELEPRIRQERRSYDNWVTGRGLDE